MKILAQVVTAGALLMLLQGCQLGSSTQLGNGSVVAGDGTTFSLATVASISPAFFHTFNLTGSDTSGNTWSGSFSVQNLPGTNFNGGPAIPRVQTLALTNTQTNAFVNSQQILFLGAGFQILGWADNLTGVNCVPQGTFAPLPATVAVGQSGLLGTLGCSDGNQRQYSWREDGTTSTLGTLVLITTVQNAGGITLATEEDGYLLDAAGAIHGFTLFTRELNTGVALTLQSPVT